MVETGRLHHHEVWVLNEGSPLVGIQFGQQHCKQKHCAEPNPTALDLCQWPGLKRKTEKYKVLLLICTIHVYYKISNFRLSITRQSNTDSAKFCIK